MREDLIKKREAKKLSRTMMAQKCECSERLIFGIEEDDWITHPDIASRLAAGYGFGIRTFNQLVHEDKRVKELPKPVPPPQEKPWGGTHSMSMKEQIDRDLYMWKRNKHDI